MRVPGQGPALVARVDAGHGLRELVAAGLADAKVESAVTGELVGLVKDDQLIGCHRLFGQPGKGLFAGQRVHADDDAVAAGAGERISVLGVLPADDAERQVEEDLQFALPVADQSGRRHDQHAGQEAPRKHFAHVESGHDRLAGAGVVSQQKA